jgi:hypothetical protein
VDIPLKETLKKELTSCLKREWNKQLQAVKIKRLRQVPRLKKTK